MDSNHHNIVPREDVPKDQDVLVTGNDQDVPVTQDVPITSNDQDVPVTGNDQDVHVNSNDQVVPDNVYRDTASRESNDDHQEYRYRRRSHRPPQHCCTLIHGAYSCGRADVTDAAGHYVMM